MIHFIVMAGLGPAIHVFACECVDARITSGHDELVGTIHQPNRSEH
jgi:hypothetical protein